MTLSELSSDLASKIQAYTAAAAVRAAKHSEATAADQAFTKTQVDMQAAQTAFSQLMADEVAKAQGPQPKAPAIPLATIGNVGFWVLVVGVLVYMILNW